MSQYDPWVIREALHNCIAHQDYTKGGKINLVEWQDDSLLFSNVAEFLPGDVLTFIRSDTPPEIYRNRFLVDAMVNLGMIDTIGSGIRRMYRKQHERNFPLPEADLSEAGRVKFRIFGRVLDEKYTRLLHGHPKLDLFEVVALDKLQKKRPLSDDEFRNLKAKGLIEGRRPNCYISAKVAAATDEEAAYLRNKGLDDEFYKGLVLGFFRQFGSAKRADIDKLLKGKLSDTLDQKQAKNKIKNLLSEMARDGAITKSSDSPQRGPGVVWVLSKPSPDGAALPPLSENDSE